MTTTAREYLDRYNAAAVALGEPTLKSPWKSSTAAIQAKCNEIENRLKEKTVMTTKKSASKKSATPKQAAAPKQPTAASEFVAWCKAHGKNPKVVRAKLRKMGVKKEGKRYDLDAIKALA